MEGGQAICLCFLHLWRFTAPLPVLAKIRIDKYWTTEFVRPPSSDSREGGAMGGLKIGAEFEDVFIDGFVRQRVFRIGSLEKVHFGFNTD